MLLLVIACSVPDIESAQVGDVVDTEVMEESVMEDVTVEEIAAVGDNEQELSATFEFEGYAPGKSHTGTFDMFSVVGMKTSEGITSAKAVFDASSVNTGIAGLDSHLKNEDFFDVEQYPLITVEITEVGTDSVTSFISFHGVSREVVFPANVSADMITADFLLDTEPFNMKYTGVDQNVRIAFTVQ